MGFKTDYKEITLKELCNLNCIMRHNDVILYDYKGTLEHPIILSELGCIIDNIPEIFADWYVEYFDIDSYMDASGLMNNAYIFYIREP